MSDKEQEIRSLSFLYKAPAADENDTVWVTFSDILTVGNPVDGDTDEELEFLNKIKVQIDEDKHVIYKFGEWDPTEEFEDLEADDLDKCSICRIDFPSELIQQTVSSEGSFFSCPVCALKNRNKVSGLPMSTPFQGEMASLMYDTAVAWLKFTKQWSGKEGLPE